MGEDTKYQEKLAVEFMSPRNCSTCKYYYYGVGTVDQECLLHSVPIDNCNIVVLDRENKLNGRTRS